MSSSSKPRAPDRVATIDDLQQARKELGPAVGQRAFKDYVVRNYGRVQDSTLRDFLRKEPVNQVFAAPPKSEGRVVTTGRQNDWHLDLMALPKGDPEYKYIMIAQNRLYWLYLCAARNGHYNHWRGWNGRSLRPHAGGLCAGWVSAAAGYNHGRF